LIKSAEYTFKSIERLYSICLNEIMNTTSSLGPRFLIVWFGQSVSTLGSIVSGVGIAVWVFVETGSSAWLGLLVALAAAPYVATGPLLPLVDRIPRRTVMIGADVVAATGTAVALVLAVVGALEVWHLALVGFVGGVGTAFQFPAFQAAIPSLVDHEALGRANGLNQLGPAAGVVLGPVIATPLVAWSGIGAVLAVDALTFVIAIGCTLAVRFTEPVTEHDTADTRTWSSALAWLRGDGRAVATLLVVMAVVNLFLAFFNVALISLATTLGGAASAGLVMGAGGVAMLVGTLVLGQTGVPRQRIGAFGLSLILVGIGFAVAASRPSFGLLILGVVIALATVPVVNAAVSTVYHERVPPMMQGRIFGLRAAVGRALEPVGALTAGIAISAVAEPAMADGGIGAATIGQLIGVGGQRGSALVVAMAGVAVGLLGLTLLRSQVRRHLDTESVIADTGTPEGAIVPYG
jgi:MFS family permease